MTGQTDKLITDADDDECARMAAVRRYDILDTPPDGTFDQITVLAARLLGTPISIVSIVDTDRIWFKSHHGLDAAETGRDQGLCASAILQGKPWLIADAAVDPLACTNPLVAGELGLRFYLGIPLTTTDGFNLGTLCVADREPRTATEDDIATLECLAAIVVDELELRLSARRVIGLQERRRRHAEEDAELYRRASDSLKAGLESNREIGKALGLMMAFHKINDVEAFEVIRQASQDMNVKLREVAREVVQHHNSRGEEPAI